MGLKHKKAVIFDLDGTLVDSMWMWKDIDIEFLKNYGHDWPCKALISYAITSSGSG